MWPHDGIKGINKTAGSAPPVMFGERNPAALFQSVLQWNVDGKKIKNASGKIMWTSNLQRISTKKSILKSDLVLY